MKNNSGLTDNMNEGTPPDLTTQGMPTRQMVKEDMCNPDEPFTGLKYAGYMGAPDATILPGGSPV